MKRKYDHRGIVLEKSFFGHKIENNPKSQSKEYNCWPKMNNTESAIEKLSVEDDLQQHDISTTGRNVELEEFYLKILSKCKVC